MAWHPRRRQGVLHDGHSSVPLPHLLAAITALTLTSLADSTLTPLFRVSVERQLWIGLPGAAWGAPHLSRVLPALLP